MFDNIAQFCDHVAKDIGREREDPAERDKCYIAHNGGRYDFHLVARGMLERDSRYKCERISKGNTIVMLKYFMTKPMSNEDKRDELQEIMDAHSYIGARRNKTRLNARKKRKKAEGDSGWADPDAPFGVVVTFIDSLNFLKMPLRALPATFELKQEKGDFPHGFNTGTNGGYVGPVPPFECFYPKMASRARYAELVLWYVREWRRTDLFVTNSQIEEFLASHDLGLKLVESAESKSQGYEQDWVFETEMASYCRKDVEVLRMACMQFKEECVRMFKPVCHRAGFVRGYGHVRNGEAWPVPSPWSAVTLASYCYDVWMRYYMVNGLLSHFKPEVELWVRKAFTGGRTEAVTLFKRCEDEETIKKVDFCSQYPYVNMSGLYTGGQPIVFTRLEEFETSELVIRSDEVKEFVTLDDVLLRYMLKIDPEAERDGIGNPEFVNGLCIAEISFTPPPGIFLPVLGCKRAEDNKYVFDCKTHLDVVVNGLELWEAVNQGYKVFNVKQIAWWPKNQVHRGIFAEYIKIFFAAKLEAGGWPPECRGEGKEEERKNYIAEVEAKNPGVKLNPANFSPNGKNPGRYQTAKAFIVSPWGKANQRHNQFKHAYFRNTEWDDYYRLFTDMTLDCQWDIVIPDKVGVVRYKSRDAETEMTKDTCVTVGVWTTAQGRLMLLRKLMLLHSSQVLYYDTDSIIYVYNPLNPEHGIIETEKDKLGAMADEFAQLKKDGQRCVEFVSGGPKNYAYLTADEKDPAKRAVEMKIKGHNLTSGFASEGSAGSIIQYESMRSLIITHATKAADLEFMTESMLDSALELRPPAHPYLPQAQEAEPVQQLEVQSKLRFKLGTQLNITTIDARLTYGWSFDKRKIDAEGLTLTCIPTLPLQ
jgi:hypothetical protein